MITTLCRPRYLNDLDCEQQYQGLGVAPLPLHGQVRPIKVEAGAEQEAWQPHDDQHPSNLSSTPPILRRRGRKRDAEEEKLDQVNIVATIYSYSDFIIMNLKAWKHLGSEIQNKCLNTMPFTPSKVQKRPSLNKITMAALNASL